MTAQIGRHHAWAQYSTSRLDSRVYNFGCLSNAPVLVHFDGQVGKPGG
jgi:hypothetical protein